MKTDLGGLLIFNIHPGLLCSRTPVRGCGDCHHRVGLWHGFISMLATSGGFRMRHSPQMRAQTQPLTPVLWMCVCLCPDTQSFALVAENFSMQWHVLGVMTLLFFGSMFGIRKLHVITTLLNLWHRWKCLCYCPQPLDMWHYKWLLRKKKVRPNSQQWQGESLSAFSVLFDRTLLPQEVFQQNFFEIKRKKQGNGSLCYKGSTLIEKHKKHSSGCNKARKLKRYMSHVH